MTDICDDCADEEFDAPLADDQGTDDAEDALEGVATSIYWADEGEDIGELRQGSGPTVAELVKPGMTVRTSYNTTDTVAFVSGPYSYEGHEHYTIVLGKPGGEGKGWINECVAVDGRILKLFEANDDEIFVSGEPDLKAIADLEERRAVRASYSAGTPSLSDLKNLRRLGDSIEWQDAEQGGRRYQRASVYLNADGTVSVNPGHRSYLDHRGAIGIDLTKGWMSHPDHVNVSATIRDGCGYQASCMSGSVAKKVVDAWCKANPVQRGLDLFAAIPAQPGHPTEEPGADGLPQLVIPGAERVTPRQQLQHRASQPLRARAPQKGVEGLGLFGADTTNQPSLF